MKLAFTLLLVVNAFCAYSQKQPVAYKVAAFKHVPDEMLGCGDTYYLTAKDKKEAAFICITDMESVLLNINGKPVKFKAESTGGNLVSGKYTLIINTTKRVNDDVEHYTMRGHITLKVGAKIVWSSKVLGEGGC
jgi:hypothetical protein